MADIAEERARRREEAMAREEAAQERRRVLQEERKAKLRDLDERRRDQVPLLMSWGGGDGVDVSVGGQD